MRLRRSGVHRVALILTIATIICEFASASTQCKMVVMDVHMKRCRPGARPKRAAERLDLQKHDVRSMGREEGPDRTRMDDESMSHGAPRKRQLSALELGSVALPIVTQTFHNDLGVYLSNDELGELYDDICERPPRASKEDAWKVFLETASRCCKNVDRCLKEATHVPCLTF